jgi:hypothetical protein
MRYAALFLWLAVPLGVWSVYVGWGTPHAIWEYQFLDNGNPNDPLAPRFYTSCTFIGWTGVVRVPAEAGKCAWVRFFKEEMDQ